METPTTFAGLVAEINNLINLAIPAIIAVVFVVFIWKIFDAWVIHADDERKRTEGRQLAVTGTIVMVLMLLVWGLVVLLQTSIFG